MIHVYGMIHFKDTTLPLFGRLNTLTITSLLIRSTGDSGAHELLNWFTTKCQLCFKAN